MAEDERVNQFRVAYTKNLRATENETEEQLKEIQEATEAWAKSMGKKADTAAVAKAAAKLRKVAKVQTNGGIKLNDLLNGDYNK